MANRILTLPDTWARLAQTIIPEPPVNGTSYRNTAMGAAVVNQGWPYNVAVPSEYHNQIMYLITSLIQLLEQSGVLPWCATTAYVQGALTLGSDNKIYMALQTSTNKDPTTQPAYWKSFELLILANLKYGNWTSKLVGSIYQAETDGTVYALPDINATGADIRGYTDASNPPTIMRQCFRHRRPHSDSGYTVAGITMDVRKGDWWKVTGAETVYWISKGI